MAIAADATLEELHAKLVESGFTKLPVYEKSLDDIIGVVYSQDLLQVADTDLPNRHVRELMKPVLFMPETKVGSESAARDAAARSIIAVIIDEHGSVAGIATMEDLVEEIVGESGADGTHPKLEMVREGISSLVMRGSTAIADVEEMLGVHFGEDRGRNGDDDCGIAESRERESSGAGREVRFGGISI